jgi:hypothetical protein
MREHRKLLGIFYARHRRAQHFADAAGVGPQRHGRLLRAPQPRRGDKFHRARNLLRILHRTNPPPEIEKCGHRMVVRYRTRRERAAALAWNCSLYSPMARFSLRARVVGNLFFLGDLHEQRAVARVHELDQVLSRIAECRRQPRRRPGRWCPRKSRVLVPPPRAAKIALASKFPRAAGRARAALAWPCRAGRSRTARRPQVRGIARGPSATSRPLAAWP